MNTESDTRLRRAPRKKRKPSGTPIGMSFYARNTTSKHIPRVNFSEHAHRWLIMTKKASARPMVVAPQRAQRLNDARCCGGSYWCIQVAYE